MTGRALNITVALAVAAGLAALLVFVPKASAAEPDTLAPRWQVWIKRPGEDWQVYTTKHGAWSFGLHTSCALDLPSIGYVEPSGTALACLRIGASPVARR